jgi:2-oxoglutarate ferredoxin oxidoreductase subunit gamma
MRKEIRISGFGGQGVVLAGYLLGKALTIYEGFEAVMTQSYGPEARGGASSSNVVVADRPIDYPFIQHADVLVALSQEGYTRFRPETSSEAIILIDSGLVNPDPADKVLGIPATDLAQDLGRRIIANVLMLGFFSATTGIVQMESLIQAVKSTVPNKVVDLNLNALQEGFDYHRLREGMA